MWRLTKCVFLFAAGQAFQSYMMVKRHERFERIVNGIADDLERTIRSAWESRARG